MKKIIITSVVTTLASLLLISAPVLACHPVGTIVKNVQNLTTGSAVSNADTSATALAAKPGDTLRYTIVIGNSGSTASNDNAMVSTVLTDSLPDGVTLVSNPAERTISETIGTVNPGTSVTKTYDVKVTATTPVSIKNEACFTAKNTQGGAIAKTCDVAFVTVTIPTPPVTPVTPVTPTSPAVMPAELPNTGIANIVPVFLTVSGLGYVSMLVFKRRSQA